MTGLRSLLRLEDKVAGEARRLENIGGPPMRWVAFAVVIAAAALHGVVLLLPTVRTRATPTASSPMPDFPLVWRPVPAPVQPPVRPSEQPVATVSAPPPPAATRPAAVEAVRALTTEPVPEPAPELALNTISADVEAIIPNPDAPPPAFEAGPPPALLPPNPPEPAPVLVERLPPVYPVAARSLRAEGRVTLRLAVLPDGSVGRAIIEESSRRGLGFEAAALAAVKRWRYEPAAPQSAVRTAVVTVHFQSEEVRP